MFFILFCFVQGVCRDLSCHDQACAAEALAEAGLEGALSDHGCWQPNAKVKSQERKKSTFPFLIFTKVCFFFLELQNRVKHLPQLLKQFILPP